MNTHSLCLSWRLTLAAAAVVAATASLSAEDGAVQRRAQLPATALPGTVAGTAADLAAPNAEPKPLDESITAGIEYLLKHQQDGGGFGQGGGWRTGGGQRGGRVEGAKVEDPADLGNTCIGLMALLRTGNTPATGAYREAATKAFEFLCRQVEKSDDASLYVTSVRDTQLQSKIGQYVDTFLAGWTLSELKGRVPEELEKRRAEVLNKVVAKIEKNQKENGSFEGNGGWASVLSQGLASKALNGAARSGANVSAQALAKDQRQNEEGLNQATGTFAPATAAEPSSAGISLYREASKLGGLWEKNATNAQGRKRAEAVVADTNAPEPAKAQARADLDRIQKEDNAAQVATRAVAGKLADAKFVSGFGNNGGEEFLSYLTLAEALCAKGGKEWEDWKTKTSLTVRSAQNADGGWSGHHCITGRTFCTGAALLVLTVGRDPGAGVAKVEVPADSSSATVTLKLDQTPTVTPSIAPAPAPGPLVPSVPPVPPVTTVPPSEPPTIAPPITPPQSSVAPQVLTLPTPAVTPASQPVPKL